MIYTNQKVVYFKAQKDGNNYRYRIGFQVTPSTLRDHTLAIEQFFLHTDTWEKAEITIAGTGISLPYSHTTKFSYTFNSFEYYYTKTIVQFKKLIAVEYYIYYTTHIDNPTQPSPLPNQLPLYLVVYGVDSFVTNVDSSVYNIQLFETKKMKEWHLK